MFIISVRSRSFTFACFIWIWLTCSENHWRARSGQPTVLTRDANRRAYEKTWCRRILLSPVSPVFSVIVVSICPRLNDTDLAKARLTIANGRARRWKSDWPLFVFFVVPRRLSLSFHVYRSLICKVFLKYKKNYDKNHKSTCFHSPNFNSR